ncbi:Protein kinase superfamily protein [Prunus dulcis]|uniref:Protein kinase superfamily protein n=1 Tax=Prunus dulcis TaxID=3755 RepID=A0A5H2XJN3_PRUDU|nr:Protein kinase superfamily protein [Prunus dulcis]
MLEFSIIPRVKRKEEKEERKRAFLKNGSMLLEDLIASCDGKSHPIRCYSAAEIIRAANNYPCCIIDRSPFADLYRGILDDRTVIIKKYRDWVDTDRAIRDIIISMQMSTHKNSLKLLGCCLEFEMPALVFENAGKGGLNFDASLVADNELLPWKTRLRIAKQLASALTYLHTAFPRPIIHRRITSHCILLDDDCVPKLFDFSLSLTIPPDQLYVQEDFATGRMGYLDPTYRQCGPKILEEVGGDEQAQQQLQDF